MADEPLLLQLPSDRLHDAPPESSCARPNHVHGCPGCLLETRKLNSRALPTKELFLVAVLTLCNSLPISSLFPFIYFMVDNFHITSSDSEVAFYAGFIGSAFMAGRFLSSTHWGIIADKYGRKPVIICGTVSILAFNSLFGFSTTLWMALLSRFLLGFFNGLIGTIRAYVSEICHEDQQAFGMSLVGTMWGLGLIIGPAIGGYLAQPGTKFPGVFRPGSIFYEFPYALPCLCISAFAAVSFALSFSVPESLHKYSVEIKAKTSQLPIQGLPHSFNQIQTKSIFNNWDFISAMMVYCIWSLHDMAYTEIFSLWAVSPKTLCGLELTTSEVGIILAISGGALLVFQMLIYPGAQKRLGPIRLCQYSAESLHKYSVDIMEKTSQQPIQGLPYSFNQIQTKSIFNNWDFISAMMVYCIWSLHDMAYTEIFSLWAVSPKTLCGLELTTSEVGIILAISGGALLVFQMLIYPGAQKRLGPIRLCQYSAIISTPLTVVYPLIARLSGSWLWILLIVASSIKNILSVLLGTASFILINHSVASEQRGIANGASMSVMSLFKAVGPAAAGFLLSWAESRLQTNFFPGTWTVFSVLALFCVFTALTTVEPFMPRSLDHPKPEIRAVRSLALQ